MYPIPYIHPTICPIITPHCRLQAVSGAQAAQLRRLQAFLEAMPQPQQATPHDHLLCWALAPHGALPPRADDMLQLPDNCIDGDLLVTLSCMVFPDALVS